MKSAQVCNTMYVETCGYDKNMILVKTFSNECVACSTDKTVQYYKSKGKGPCEMKCNCKRVDGKPLNIEGVKKCPLDSKKV